VVLGVGLPDQVGEALKVWVMVGETLKVGDSVKVCEMVKLGEIVGETVMVAVRVAVGVAVAVKERIAMGVVWATTLLTVPSLAKMVMVCARL
jgi:hypothetical protein